MSARVTMKDIAAELGVSINTVHKALTGKAGVSESVRAKVNAKAEAMGYLPYIDLTVSDGVVTAVAQGTIPEPDLSALRTAKLSELSSACNAAIVAGCDVTLSTTTGHIGLTDEDQINLTTTAIIIIKQFHIRRRILSCTGKSMIIIVISHSLIP